MARRRRKQEHNQGAPAGAVVYIGPTRGALISGSVYRQGLPEAGHALVARHALARLLFVTPDELAAAQREVSMSGTSRNVAFSIINR